MSISNKLNEVNVDTEENAVQKPGISEMGKKEGTRERCVDRPSREKKGNETNKHENNVS